MRPRGLVVSLPAAEVGLPDLLAEYCQLDFNLSRYRSNTFFDFAPPLTFDAKIISINNTTAGENYLTVSARVAQDAGIFMHFKSHLPGDAPQSQVTVEEGLPSLLLNACGLENDRRVVFCVKPVRRSQVLVPPSQVCINTLGINDHGCRGPGDVVRVEIN